MKDEQGAAAVHHELSAHPTGVVAANANLAYGALPGNKTTQADAVQAYAQSLLKSKHSGQRHGSGGGTSVPCAFLHVRSMVIQK